MSGPLISVVVPVHNAASSLHRGLRSVLGQTLIDFELIVIDDCSTDESASILKRYSELDTRVRLFSTERNGGPGAARNVGLRNARGQYVAFLDADDFWTRDKLERQIRCFEDNEVILSHTSVVLLNTRGDVLGMVNGRRRMSLWDMFVGNRIAMSSAMIRRDLIGAEEMPEMRNREDYAYWISLLKQNGGCVSRVPDALCGYVQMPGSLSSNAMKNIVDTYRMYVSEVGVSPVLAAALVVVFACVKCYKELAARVRWMCLSQDSKRKLEEKMDVSWNWDEQGKET